MLKVVKYKTSNPPSSLAFRSLAAKYHHRVLFGEIKAEQKAAADKLGIKKQPPYICFLRNGEVHDFQGEVKYSAMDKAIKKALEEADAAPSAKDEL